MSALVTAWPKEFIHRARFRRRMGGGGRLAHRVDSAGAQAALTAPSRGRADATTRPSPSRYGTLGPCRENASRGCVACRPRTRGERSLSRPRERPPRERRAGAAVIRQTHRRWRGGKPGIRSTRGELTVLFAGSNDAHTWLGLERSRGAWSKSRAAQRRRCRRSSASSPLVEQLTAKKGGRYRSRSAGRRPAYAQRHAGEEGRSARPLRGRRKASSSRARSEIADGNWRGLAAAPAHALARARPRRGRCSPRRRRANEVTTLAKRGAEETAEAVGGVAYVGRTSSISSAAPSRTLARPIPVGRRRAPAPRDGAGDQGHRRDPGCSASAPARSGHRVGALAEAARAAPGGADDVTDDGRRRHFSRHAASWPTRARASSFPHPGRRRGGACAILDGASRITRSSSAIHGRKQTAGALIALSIASPHEVPSTSRRPRAELVDTGALVAGAKPPRRDRAAPEDELTACAPATASLEGDARGRGLRRALRQGVQEPAW